MLRRYLMAIFRPTTEHPHKLPDLIFKELAESPQLRRSSLAHLVSSRQQHVCCFRLARFTSQCCEAAYYTALSLSVNPCLQKNLNRVVTPFRRCSAGNPGCSDRLLQVPFRA